MPDDMNVRTFDGNHALLSFNGIAGGVETTGRLVTIHPPWCVLMVPTGEHRKPRAGEWIQNQGGTSFDFISGKLFEIWKSDVLCDIYHCYPLTPRHDEREAAWRKHAKFATAPCKTEHARQLFLAGYDAAKAKGN